MTIKIDVEDHENQVIEAPITLLGQTNVMNPIVEVDLGNFAWHGSPETLFTRLGEKGLKPCVNDPKPLHNNEFLFVPENRKLPAGR